MGVPSLNDLAVDGTLNTTNQQFGHLIRYALYALCIVCIIKIHVPRAQLRAFTATCLYFSRHEESICYLLIVINKSTSRQIQTDNLSKILQSIL